MDNQRVTLIITAANESWQDENLHDYISSINVFDEPNGNFKLNTQIEYRNVSELELGNLNELRSSYITIDTSARRRNNSNLNNRTARVSYEIKYGIQVVEKITIESFFSDQTHAFLQFKFKFCPRFPFC